MYSNVQGHHHDGKVIRFIVYQLSQYHWRSGTLLSWCQSSIMFVAFFNRTTHYTHHHHHVALVARISLTLSRHSSLSFIAPGRSSGQHPVSSHCCWMYVRAGRPAFARPCMGVHKSTSLMSSSLRLHCVTLANSLLRSQLFWTFMLDLTLT